MAWRGLMSYWTVVGLTAQSSRWEQSMYDNLEKMSLGIAQSASLQTSSVANEEMAMKNEQAATAYHADAADLQEQANVLLEKSEADLAMATSEQMEVEALEGDLAIEEEQSAAHFGAAAIDEVTFDSEMAEGAADAGEASRMEAQAHGEEFGVAVCELVPLLDVACYIVGGVTAVGMEVGAAGMAAKAVGEIGAAQAIKLEEESEIAIAVKLQSKAGEDASLAAELQVEADTETKMAEDERIAGEELEAEAQVLLEHAEVKEAAAAEETTMAAEQAEEAAALATESFMNGVLSCWDGILASFFGILSVSFFSFRLTTAVVAPAVSSIIGFISTFGTVQKSFSMSLWRNISYAFHHCAIYFLLSGACINLFDGLKKCSLKSRGGIILCFALTGAATQITLLHILPSILARSQTFCKVMGEVLRLFIVLPILYTLEILILWVTVGPSLFAQSWLCELSSWWVWIIFFVSLGYHSVALEIPSLKTGAVKSSTSAHSVKSTNFADVPTETDCLLPLNDNDILLGSEVRKRNSPTESWFASLLHEVMQLQLPFEILVLSIVVALVFRSLSVTYNLWPASKTLLLAARPEWLVPFAIATVLVVLCGTIFSCVPLKPLRILGRNRRDELSRS